MKRMSIVIAGTKHRTTGSQTPPALDHAGLAVQSVYVPDSSSALEGTNWTPLTLWRAIGSHKALVRLEFRTIGEVQ
ncbi:hypothetical protein [Rhizobium leguminosarum]|uniref:hypothetical protein n=1 Tax=Rhizobium leguminosarum TaxID=384 RepID=UPI0011AE48B9|nr:hypothetical protein [Rhizobium leguminosarum]